MFEELDQKIDDKNSEEGIKKSGVNEFIISHNKDFSQEKKEVFGLDKNNSGSDKKLKTRIEELEEKGKKRGKRYFLIGIIGVLVIGLVIIIIVRLVLSQTKNISNEVDESLSHIPDIREKLRDKLVLRNAWLKCEKDNDCVEIKKDCCDCYEGGEQVAINRKYFDAWYELLNKHCNKKECLDLKNCVEGQVHCEDNVCKYISKKELDLKEQDYYDLLKNKCLGDVCCLSSLNHMRENQYLECSENEQCLDNFICVHDDCPISLSWCALDRKDFATDTEEIVDLKNIDSDQDGLNDEEEIFYGTDKNNPDSDGDGYLDGEEVRKGYNPLGEGKL